MTNSACQKEKRYVSFNFKGLSQQIPNKGLGKYI